MLVAKVIGNATQEMLGMTRLRELKVNSNHLLCLVWQNCDNRGSSSDINTTIISFVIKTLTIAPFNTVTVQHSYHIMKNSVWNWALVTGTA